MINLRAIIYGLAGVGLGFLAGIWYPHETTKPVGVATEAPQTKVLATVPTETLDCKPVVVYREAAKAKTALPKAVQDDATKHVTSATTVQPGLRPQLITSLYDSTTGTTTAYSTPMAMPWLAADKRGEAGIAYGYGKDGSTIRLEVRQALLDLKAMKVGVTGSYDQPMNGADGNWFAGAGVWYRWQ